MKDLGLQARKRMIKTPSILKDLPTIYLFYYF